MNTRSLFTTTLLASMFAAMSAFASTPAPVPPPAPAAQVSQVHSSAVGSQAPSSAVTPRPATTATTPKAVPRLQTDATHEVSHAMPKSLPLKVKIQSYDIHRTENYPNVAPQQTRQVDPYTAEIQGAARGTKLEVTVQAPSTKVDLPAGGRAPLPKAADRRNANRLFNKELARNVGQAVQEKPLFNVTSNVDSAVQKTTVEKPEYLGTHAPVTVKGRDIFNRSQLTHTTVEGAPTTVVRQEVISRRVRNPLTLYDMTQEGTAVTTKTGTTVKPYAPWVKMENVFSTPAYEKTAPDGTKQTVAKVLGLAAFPRNAEVTVTNKRLEAEGSPSATVKITKLSAAGAGAVEVPALQGDRLEIKVSYPQVANQAQGASTTSTFEVPLSSKFNRGSGPRTNGGVPYVRVIPDAKPAAPAEAKTAN